MWGKRAQVKTSSSESVMLPILRKRSMAFGIKSAGLQVINAHLSMPLFGVLAHRTRCLSITASQEFLRLISNDFVPFPEITFMVA
jgi:hypothetical protein